MCFLWWGHKYEIVRCERFTDTDMGIPIGYHTVITSICKKCGKIKQKKVKGHLYLEDINKHYE